MIAAHLMSDGNNSTFDIYLVDMSTEPDIITIHSRREERRVRKPAGVEEQLRRWGILTRLLTSKDIAELEEIISAGEVVERMVRGIYGGKRGVLVATDSRIIFVAKQWFGGSRVDSFDYDEIASVRYAFYNIYDGVAIVARGEEAVIRTVGRGDARAFREHVRARITRPSTSARSRGHVPPQIKDNVITQIERLAELKEQGMLTEGEMQEQKCELLRLWFHEQAMHNL